MALGRKIVVFDADNMMKGASSSDDISDGGFSPSTDQVNLINTPGVMYQPATATDKSTGLTGQIIASCEDPAGSAFGGLFVSQDTDQDGRFYSADSSGTLTARGSEDTGGNYVQGKTDIIAFKGEAYVTNDTYIVRWQQPATFNTTFFGFSDTFAPHPALVFEDNAYYGDGNLLLRQTTAGVVPSTILTLPSNQVIVALAIDPGSGKMLISVVGQYNVSDSLNSNAKVLYYDGFSNKTLKTVVVDQMITAFPQSEGGIYAAYGNNLGYWNGSGVTFLRNFSAITANNDQLLYKQHFANIGSTLYFIVRSQVYAHGPLQQRGEHIFYPAWKNQPGGSATDITHIANIGSGTLVYSYATSQFFSWSTTSVATSGTQTFFTNEYDFKEFNDGVWVRRIKLFYKSQVSNNASPGSISLFNEDGQVTTIGQSGVFPLTNSTGAAKASKDVQIGSGRGTLFYQLQIRVNLDTINPGIRRIEVYGDPANTP